MKKKITLIIAVFFSVFVLAGAVKMALAESVTGWIWDGGIRLNPGDVTSNTNVGWISMNRTNCDTNSDNFNDTCDINEDGVINSADTSMTVENYAVDIPSEPGDVSGYAWSENVGGIAFENGAGGYLANCPAGNGACSARRTAGDRLEGWARFVEIKKAGTNSGGWDGWIKLNGVAGGTPYGVKIDPGTGELSGYAFSGSLDGSPELGWINFEGSKATPSCQPDVAVSCVLIATGNCLSDTNCGKSNIVTQTATCLNECGGSLDKSVCESATPSPIACPSDVLETCSACSGSWREVTPD